MGVFLNVYKWGVLAPVVGVSTLLLGLVCLLLCAIFPPGLAGRWCGVVWARINALFALMQVHVQGREHVDRARSYVVVANHQSQLDILVVYGWLGLDFRWVMKQELRKVPVLGVACKRMGHIFIDRSNNAAAVASINRAKTIIGEGTSVFFFPEGTRSRDGTMLPFKKGAFRLAVDLQVPVLPVSIVGTYDILPPDTVSFRPGRAKLIFHPPIETSGCGSEKIPALMKAARAVIAAAR